MHLGSGDLGSSEFGMEFATEYRRFLKLQQQFHGKGKKLGIATHDKHREDAFTIEASAAIRTRVSRTICQPCRLSHMDPR